MRALIFTLLSLSAFAGGAASGLSGITLLPLRGKPVAASKLPGGTLFVFVTGGSHCPILRQYVPTLNALSRKWKDKGVRFFLVDEADADAKSFRGEFRAFKLDFPAYLDEKQALARRFGLDVTAKVAVVEPATGKLLFSGAIDDQFTFEGRKPNAAERTLDANLEAALAGRALPYQRGAVGCAITLR